MCFHQSFLQHKKSPEIEPRRSNVGTPSEQSPEKMHQVGLMNFDAFSARQVLKQMAKICTANASRVFLQYHI